VILARDGQGVTLHAMGRDVAEIATAVEFEKRLSRWLELGDAATVRRSDERAAILKALSEAGEPMSPSDLAAETGKRGTAVRAMLGKMVKSGEVVKPSRGLYALPPQTTDHNGHNGHNITANGVAGCDRSQLVGHNGAVVDTLDCDLVTDVTDPSGTGPDL